MDRGPDGSQTESLIDVNQERTALRTHYLLLAARLLFVFSHGALVVSASADLGWEAFESWWLVFLPAWLGNVACVLLIIASWFASVPYIKCCLGERQARLGLANPSILTDLLPEIIMSVLGGIFITLTLVGEILLCQYLDSRSKGQPNSLWPTAVLLIVVALLSVCHGVCIRTHGELFCLVGGGLLASCIVAMWVPDGPMASSGWVAILPGPVACAGLLAAAVRRSRKCALVLCREERLLRYGEQVALAVVFFALLVMVLRLACTRGDRARRDRGATDAATAGLVAGSGICAVAALRLRMVIVESRLTSVRERMILSAMASRVGLAVTNSIESRGSVDVCAAA